MIAISADGARSAAKGSARVQSASNQPCEAWRACTPTISTTSLAGPESWPTLMVILLGGGAIQLALGLAREVQPAEWGCGSWRRPGSPGGSPREGGTVELVRCHRRPAE